MKIQEQDFYYGCVLSQIIAYANTTQIRKIDGAKGLYEINGDRQILIKYSTEGNSEWSFNFRRDEIAHIKPNDAHTLFFVVLVCGARSICLLDAKAIQALLPEEVRKPQAIVVSESSGNRMQVQNVKGAVGIFPRVIFHKAFPADVLQAAAPIDTPFAWPAMSMLNVYRSAPVRLFTSNDRTFDLSDLLTSDVAVGESVTHCIGISSQSRSWSTWDENALCRIENRIRYLFEFEGFGIEVERVSKEINQACSEEFIWKIECWLGERKIDELYEQALAIVLKYKHASISLVQRHLRIGYNRATRLLEQMEARGLVSVMKSNGGRDLLQTENADE